MQCLWCLEFILVYVSIGLFSTAKRSYCKWSKYVVVLGLIILELNDSSILCKSMIRNQVTWTPKILRPLDDMSTCACFCGQYARRGILEASHWEPGPRARANKGANAGETGVGNQTRVCVCAGSRSKHLLCSLCTCICKIRSGCRKRNQENKL